MSEMTPERRIELLERRLDMSRKMWVRAAEAALAAIPGASNSTHPAYDLWLRVETSKLGPMAVVLSDAPTPLIDAALSKAEPHL